MNTITTRDTVQQAEQTAGRMNLVGQHYPHSIIHQQELVDDLQAKYWQSDDASDGASFYAAEKKLQDMKRAWHDDPVRYEHEEAAQYDRDLFLAALEEDWDNRQWSGRNETEQQLEHFSEG